MGHGLSLAESVSQADSDGTVPHPRFDPEAKMFVLQSDASATGFGAVLEQDGHVVAFVSCALTNSERQYSHAPAYYHVNV